MLIKLLILICALQLGCSHGITGKTNTDKIGLGEKSMLRYLFIDRNQKVAIDAGSFHSARSFADGLAAVMTEDGLWGFIDRSGRLVIEPIFAEARDFSEGKAAVKLPGRLPIFESSKWMFIDKTGQVQFETDFDIVYDFSESYALAQDATSVYLIDGNGKVRKLFDVDVLHLGPEPNQGLREGLLPVREMRSQKYGYIDSKSKFVIAPQFEDASSFAENAARVVVKRNGRELLGFLNRDGTFLLSPRFDIDFEFLRNSRNFSEGLAGVASVSTDNTELPHFDFIDKAGRTVFQTSSFDVGNFHEGLAFVFDAVSEKYGYVDPQGNQFILPRFIFASDFSEGLACVAVLRE
ncbi:MAG: WG repeat-containing protein [Chloracidobacterium sp.]|nr:WG repeat-containing protein [Chloracidobacterium sp.]